MEIRERISNEELAAVIKPDGTAEIKGYLVQDLRCIGKRYWFEYHCWESHQSGDAEIWYHSHEQCEVVAVVGETAAYTTLAERAEQGMQMTYKVRFDDGTEHDVFEDELMESRDSFQRPDPPVIP